MATDPDREALRIYRDPMLPPAEKRRMLEELTGGGSMALPPMPKFAGPGAGDTEPTKVGWSAGNPAILDANAAVEDDQARQAGAVEAERRLQDKPPEAPGNWLLGRAEAAPATGPQTTGEAMPETTEELPSATTQGPAPDEYRSSLNRALLQLQSSGGGPAPKPTETVSEQVQVQQGTLDPEKSADIAAAEAERDDAAMQRERAATSMAWQAEDARLRAEEQVMKERAELAEMNRRTMAETQRLRARQNQISEEIANADVKQPGLWSKDNFGENLLTALSVALFALGSKNGSGAEHVKAMANREVDRQQRWLAAKGQQRDALGTILERHYANFGDVEAAKKQSVVDILGKAELEVRRQALDAEKAGYGQAIPKLQEQAAALKAARLEAEADRDKRLGTVIQTSAARSMVRERSQALQPVTVQQPGTPAAPGAAPKAPMSAQDRKTMGELNQLGASVKAGLRGEKPPAGTAPRAAAGKAPAAAAPKAGSNLQKAAEAWRSGNPEAAIAQLTPNQKRYLAALTKLREKDPDVKTPNEALNMALKDMFQERAPTELINQGARDLVVTLGTGEKLYATSKEQAKEIGGKIAKLDGTVGGLSKMLALSRQYKGSGTVPPAVKSEIESLGNALMFELSLAQEQGTVREAELPLYEKMVGSAIANYFKDPRYDLEAGLREVRRVFAGTRQRLIKNLSTSPTGEGVQRSAREVQ